MSSRNIRRCFLLSAWRDIEVVVDVGWPFLFCNLSQKYIVTVATRTFVATNAIVVTTKTTYAAQSSFAPHKLHGRFSQISLSTRIFFNQDSDLGHETQSGWGWSGSPGSLKAGSSLVTSRRGEAVRPNEPPDSRRGRSGVTVTFLCVFPTWIFKPF